MNRVPAILLLLIACPSGHGAEPALITSPSKSPLVSFRILFHTGAVDDATGQEGTAALTAAMVSEGGTKQMAYGDIVEALFPMAASVNAQVDKEMTVFHGTTHVENLDQYYEILRAMLFEPGWRKEDFQRLNQDFLFGRPGTDRIADRRLRCTVFALLPRSVPLSLPLRPSNLPDRAVPATAEGFLATPLPRRSSATRVRWLSGPSALPSRHRQRPDPLQHVAEQPAVQMPLGQQQPIVPRVLDQPTARLHQPVLQARKRPALDPSRQP